MVQVDRLHTQVMLSTLLVLSTGMPISRAGESTSPVCVEFLRGGPLEEGEENIKAADVTKMKKSRPQPQIFSPSPRIHPRIPCADDWGRAILNARLSPDLKQTRWRSLAGLLIPLSVQHPDGQLSAGGFPWDLILRNLYATNAPAFQRDCLQSDFTLVPIFGSPRQGPISGG